ncbi:MAG: peptidoglycan DD-metalloendopeptidase family protein [Lachnospiraceae bacterium]|nr:peptidoglycan DD-metalloendopeptidase family protein [Lachnospiraceae bacterium]
MIKKRKCIRRAISFVTMLAVATSYMGIQTGATISEEKQRLKEFEQQKQDIKNTINSLESDKAAIESNIKKLDDKLSEISKTLYKTEKNLDKVGKKIENNKVKLADAQKSIELQYADMKLRIQFMYENGNQQLINLILSSESITDLLNKAEYISELSSYDRRMLDKMKATKAEIEKTEQALESEEKELLVLQTEQKEEKQNVETLVEAKQQELTAYDAKIDKAEGELGQIDFVIKSQKDEIAQMEKIEAERKAAAEKAAKEAAIQAAKNKSSSPTYVPSKPTTPSYPASNGQTSGNVTVSGYIWPLPGHTSISSGFGYRADPFSGQTSYHSGIDLPAPSGTPIVASASGQVAWSNYSTSAGNWIGIDHGNGVYTVYMHMSARLVSAGQTVSQGQTIGLVGTTGSSTGNHLHFSVRLNGTYVSPLSYVSP